jgi:hypothetical protein
LENGDEKCLNGTAIIKDQKGVDGKQRKIGKNLSQRSKRRAYKSWRIIFEITYCIIDIFILFPDGHRSILFEPQLKGMTD